MKILGGTMTKFDAFYTILSWIVVAVVWILFGTIAAAMIALLFAIIGYAIFLEKKGR